MSAATTATAATNSTVSAIPLEIQSKKNISPSPKITLTSLTPNNVGTLRTLNKAIFPISYSDKYYTEVLDPLMQDFNKIIYYSDIPVGSITCRVEPSLPPIDSSSSFPPESPTSPLKLHILTINVLPAYRHQSLGTHLLTHVLSSSPSFSWPPPPPPVKPTPPASAPASSAPEPPSATIKKPKGKENKAAAKAAAAVAEKKKKMEAERKKEEEAKKEAEEKKRVEALKRLEAVFVHCQVGNEEAKTFYLKNGFEEKATITNYYHDKELSVRDAIMFEKKI